MATLVAVAALAVLPSPAPAAFDVKLKRYPYLTDLVSTSVMVNWATDISATSAVVKYGPVGNCTANTATATRTFIFVNGVSEYQWKAQITGLTGNTQYCYRVYLGSSQLDLLGTDSSPIFTTQVPAGSTTPFKFAVWGNWGKVGPSGNPNQANLISQIAASGSRFAVTTGDNAYEVGSQKNYGDLYQTGDNTSAVFGPSFWKVAGASLPLFPAIGNHDHNMSHHLVNWPQDTAVATSGGRYQTDTYCCTNGTTQMDYPSGWYAFDAGLARFYVLETAWENTNVGSADLYKNDFDNHWGPTSAQMQWLQQDLANNPRALRFAFFHFPLYSDQSSTASDTWLRGANNLEGLLKTYDVTVTFNAHSHNYQRNSVPAGGVQTYVSGGGGANLESIGGAGCSSNDLYGLGWSNQANVGSACGAAPVPATKDRVHHFLLVSVNGTSVTVTPTDELGRTFDAQTYNAPALNANLALTKTDTPDPLLVGQQVTYNLTVTNSGPRAADGVQLTDTLPPGVIFDSATPSQGTCNQSGSTITCQMGTIANGGNATVQIKVRPQSTGVITNSATVASSINDPSTANNTATAQTTVNPAADLALTKTDSPDPVAQGTELTYNLSVSNAGPNTATGITLTDTLPAGVTFNSATPSQGSCSQSAGTVSCSLGNLVNTGSATVSIKVTPDSVTSITNTAGVTSLTGDPNTANNNASTVTTVNASANLSLTKSDAPDPVLVGQPLTYTLTTQNAGPSTAPSVQLSDTLPAGVTYNSATPSQGSCSQASGTVTCSLGSIASSASATVTIQVTPQSQGSITNTASVSSGAIDPVLTNNSASTSTLVNPVADIVVTKSDTPDPALVGQPLTYTVGVQNTGPSSAPSVSVSDTLPAGVTFNSAVPSQGSCTHSAGTVSCPLGAIANGAGASIQITVTPQSTGSISNTASATSTISDPNSANNSSTAATLVNPSANLGLTMSDSPDPVLQGNELTYSLTVTNAGPSSATSVVVTDTLPSGVTYNSGLTSQGSCANSSGTVTCALGTIASGGNATITIKVTPPSTGQITNQASVASGVSDPNTANNAASATTNVDPVADLSITKTDSPDPISSGQPLTYTVGVSNAGPSAASGVTVTDTLPAGVTFGSATPTQGSCTHSSGTVTCNLGSLANAANASIDIVVTPTAGGSITNQASVAATTADPAVVNNSASATTTVDPVADLSLTKSDSPDPVLSGHELTYDLAVHNSGPASASGVSLTDALPAGVTFVSATSSQGSCLLSGSNVVCALGTIANGGTVDVEIKVTAGAPGSVTNNATVLSTASDPNTVDNSAQAVTTIKPVADLGITKSDSPDPVLAGQLLTYDIAVSNSGPHDAADVTVTDQLDPGVTFESAVPSQGTCTESSGTVTCTLGTVANAGGATVQIKVRPQAEGTVDNQASVTSAAAGDLNSSNDTAGTETTVDPAADLELTKTDSADPILYGDELTYTLGVHNAGPSATSGVALSDSLPAGVTFESYTATQGSCLTSGNSLLCSLGTLASGADATVTITVTANAVGIIENTANVLGMTVDPDTADNAASIQTTVEPVADLSITKGDSPDPVPAGDVLTYSLAVSNAGPQDATGVTVTDTLPAGVLFESASPSQGSCTESGGTVTCELGTVANAGSATVDIQVRPPEGGQITNEASVESDVADSDSGNNSASAETTVDPSADLSLTKGDSPDPVLAGELLTYTLGVHNAGPSTATAVEVTDTLPAGVGFDSATSSQGTCTEATGTVTCELGSLADEADASVEIKVRPQDGGTLNNQATVSSAVQDPSTANNDAAAETTVDPAADLSLTKGDAPDPVLEGEQLTYSLTVSNAGPQSATNVVLTDTLPSGVTFGSATPSQGTCNESGGTVTCELGTIADDGSATVDITVTPQGPGSLTNEATVTSDLADPDAADRTASAETTVQPVADLALTKSDSPDPVAAGQELTYTLDVQNTGPRSATNVVLSDTLPVETTFVSATPSQGTCSELDGTVTCDLGTIADQAGATAEIKVTPNEGGTIVNEASVSADEGDPTTANNTASAETTVSSTVDVELAMSDSPDPVAATGLLTYTLEVHNAGPSSAPAVQLTDTLPVGVVFESASSTHGSCTELLGTVDCSLGTLAHNATATVTIDVRPQSPGTITNNASVLSLVSDGDPLDNSASEDTTVDPAADLSLTKSESADPVFLGSQLTYTLAVQNSGPETATAVTVTDTLPAGVTFDSATPTQGTCAESAGTVTCDLGSLADEQSASIDIVVTTQSTGSISNEAVVGSALNDPDPSNNSDAVETTVDGAADLSVSKTDDPDPILVDELLTYTVTVQNGGPSSATGVSVSDELPAGVTFESASPSQGTCAEASGTVTCDLGTLADQASATIEIAVRPQSAGTITNNVDVTSDIHDSDTGNNSASAETTVNRVADLTLSKSDSPDPAFTGEQVTYTLSVHNNGPSAATGTTVTDTLPGGVTYESATSSQGSCSQASGTVTCNLGTLANGGDATVTITIRSPSAGTKTNQAGVTSDATDPDTNTNSASAQTTVNAAGGYVRPQTANVVRVPFVPAYAACASPNRMHGPPLEHPSCNPPVRASDHLTLGSPDVNGAGANASGFAKFSTIISPPSSNDVGIRASMTDVRCGTMTAACGNLNTQSGPDYTGQLELAMPLRITDRFNGAGGGVPATVSDTTFPVPFSCLQTPSAAVGSNCDITTTANALLPGSVQTTRRTVWQIDRVELLDGGADGVAATAGNGVLATQGVFIP